MPTHSAIEANARRRHWCQNGSIWGSRAKGEFSHPPFQTEPKPTQTTTVHTNDLPQATQRRSATDSNNKNNKKKDSTRPHSQKKKVYCKKTNQKTSTLFLRLTQRPAIRHQRHSKRLCVKSLHKKQHCVQMFHFWRLGIWEEHTWWLCSSFFFLSTCSHDCALCI